MAAVPGDCRSTLVVIGGGAAGYFGAIQAASSSSLGERPDSSSSDAVVAGSTRNNLSVVVLEAGKLPLQKVKISGGGRCNVMHDTSKVQCVCVVLSVSFAQRMLPHTTAVASILIQRRRRH